MSEEKRPNTRRSGQFRSPASKFSDYDDAGQEISPDFSVRETQDVFTGDEEDARDIVMMRPGSSGITRSRQSAGRDTTGIQIAPLSQRRTGQRRPYAGEADEQPSSRYAQSTPKARKKSLLPQLLKGRVHWLLPLGLGMIAMLILWEVGSVALGWGANEYNNIVYGMPRTYQTDFVVGHGDSPAHPSHFLAINLNHQAIVVEFPAGNPQNAKSYVVPYYILGTDSAEVPVTVNFKDVNGDGKPDMIVHIHLSTQDQTFVFINDGKQFRAPTSKDHINMNS